VIGNCTLGIGTNRFRRSFCSRDPRFEKASPSAIRSSLMASILFKRTHWHEINLMQHVGLMFGNGFRLLASTTVRLGRDIGNVTMGSGSRNESKTDNSYYCFYELWLGNGAIESATNRFNRTLSCAGSITDGIGGISKLQLLCGNLAKWHYTRCHLTSQDLNLLYMKL
jgi:hypothetical protein